MKQQTKLNSEQQQSHAAEHQTHQQNGREFASVEEMLRFDAAHTEVPPGIAQRLNQSAGELPAPKAVWWKRMFGGGNP